MKGQDVKDAEWLLSGHGRFKEIYYHGALDGIYGPHVALAAYEAKYWLGFPTNKLDHAFGSVLRGYLLPLSSSDAVKLPIAYRTRRALRIQKKLELAYVNPYRNVVNFRFAGVDQGVDFGGEGPVYAIGPARITNVSTTSGWPGGGAVGYTLTSGAKAGAGIYFVENITPSVRPGQLVDHQTVIATMHNAYPYTESGWAHPGTVNPIASLYPNPHSPKTEGQNFYNWLQTLEGWK
jgi:hypothetical protein